LAARTRSASAIGGIPAAALPVAEERAAGVIAIRPLYTLYGEPRRKINIQGVTSMPPCMFWRHYHSTLSLTVVGCHSLGFYAVVSLSLLSLSANMTVPPAAWLSADRS
jgi:hypothetical protein